MKSLLTTFFLFLMGITTSFGQLDDTDVRYSDLPPEPEYGKCYAKCKSPDISTKSCLDILSPKPVPFPFSFVV